MKKKKPTAAKKRTVTEETVIKMMADPLRRIAWEIARWLRCEPENDSDSAPAAIAGNMIALFQDSPDLRRLLNHIADDDITDITKWPMPDDWRTIQAWRIAKIRAGRRGGNGYDLFVKPSFEEVQTQFVSLFPNITLPAEWTIRKTLKRYNLPMRTVPRGRRKGSKDTTKRKRRWRRKPLK